METTPSSSPDTPAADSEEVARLAERLSEEDEVSTDTREALIGLEEEVQKVGLTESLKKFFDEINSIIKEVLVKLGLIKEEETTTEESNEDESSGIEPTSPESSISQPAEISRLSFNRVGSRTDRSKVYNRTQRQGRNIYTGGMPGRLWGEERNKDGGTDAQFEIDSELSVSQIRDLVENLGIRTFITLSGAGSADALQGKLRSLGYSQVQVKTVRIPTARSVEEANSAWQRARFISSVRSAYTAYQDGNCFIHCHNGMHRSVAMSLILFMLSNPELTYEQALSLNVSPREQQDHNFLAYAQLAKVLEGNSELRTRILNSSEQLIS